MQQTVERAVTADRLTLWGSQLSPYFLKIESLCRGAGRPVQRRPDGGSALENLRLMRRLDRAKRTRSVQRWPSADPLDEYPLVPYLMTADGAVHYDSSGIAGWLDAQRGADEPALIPDDPELAFACALIDEALDEVGLYLVHHHRWVVSHDDNDAGVRLANEFRSVLLPPLRPLIARRFSARQIRRLPYLFSVADSATAPSAGRPSPPTRAGFPATHMQIERAWDELVDALTQALRGQPYLLGDRFTLADAAVYGQFGMNLSDPSSERRLRERSPALRAWLGRIERGAHDGSRGALCLHDYLRPLFAWIATCFVPLMRANAEAYARLRAQDCRRWNEQAFDRGEALYELDWRGAPARTVVKTFQYRVWRDLCARARALPAGAFAAQPFIAELVPAVDDLLDHPQAVLTPGRKVADAKARHAP